MKIRIIKEPYRDATGVLFYEERNNKIYIIKPVELVEEEYKEGNEYDPTFRLYGLNQHEFIRSMAEVAEENGVKTVNRLNEESQNKGVLEATKYHLEDMRKLVFDPSTQDQGDKTK